MKRMSSVKVTKISIRRAEEELNMGLQCHEEKDETEKFYVKNDHHDGLEETVFLE